MYIAKMIDIPRLFDTDNQGSLCRSYFIGDEFKFRSPRVKKVSRRFEARATDCLVGMCVNVRCIVVGMRRVSIAVMPFIS